MSIRRTATHYRRGQKMEPRYTPALGRYATNRLLPHRLPLPGEPVFEELETDDPGRQMSVIVDFPAGVATHNDPGT